MGDKNCCPALAGAAPKRIENDISRRAIQVSGWFITEEDRFGRSQRAGGRYALTLSAGQRGGEGR